MSGHGCTLGGGWRIGVLCSGVRRTCPNPAERASTPVEDAPMKIEFIASVAAISVDPLDSRRLYVDALGLPLDHAEGDDYYHSEAVGGSKHFGLWPLRQVAQACFGSEEWPPDRQVPQASFEFELSSPEAVGEAVTELEAAGFALLHPSRREPWGQTVALLTSP